MAHMAHSWGEKTTRAGGGTPYTGAHTVPWPTRHTLEGEKIYRRVGGGTLYTGPIPSHGPHSALSRGEELREREEAPRILGPYRPMAHTAHSRGGENLYKSGRRNPVYWGPYHPWPTRRTLEGEKIYRRAEEAPRILGPIPSHGPHGALSRGEELREREEAPHILGPIPSHGPHGTLSRGEELRDKNQRWCFKELKTYFNAPLIIKRNWNNLEGRIQHT